MEKELKKTFHRNETACPLTYEILRDNARKNRLNMTEAEKVLWDELKDRNGDYVFRRQHIIGDYIVDFVCLRKRLIIEVDGGYHSALEQQKEDALRAKALQNAGYDTLRFTNEEVTCNLKSVLDKIRLKLQTA